MAFERLSGPIDLGERVDVAAAWIVTVLANIHRDRKKRPKPFVLSDFLLDWSSTLTPGPSPARGGQVTRGKSPEEMLSVVEMLNEAFGGRDLRRG